jgi:hypothetical protein
MLRFILTLTAAALLALGTVTISSESGAAADKEAESAAIGRALGEETYTSLGLDRLSTDEQERLFNHFATAPAPEYTYESAVAYFRKNDWRPVRVLGIIPDPRWTDEYFLVVWDRYKIYTLDPFGRIDPPLPGVYFAKSSLSSWTLLSLEGDELSFYAKDLE